MNGGCRARRYCDISYGIAFHDVSASTTSPSHAPRRAATAPNAAIIIISLMPAACCRSIVSPPFPPSPLLRTPQRSIITLSYATSFYRRCRHYFISRFLLSPTYRADEIRFRVASALLNSAASACWFRLRQPLLPPSAAALLFFCRRFIAPPRRCRFSSPTPNYDTPDRCRLLAQPRRHRFRAILCCRHHRADVAVYCCFTPCR